MKKLFVQRIIALLLVSLFIVTSASIAFAHPGRTDASGGHRDNKNASGLGSYHYHHGMGPHLHPGGVCPYGGGSGGGNNATQRPAATQRPTQSQPQATKAPAATNRATPKPTATATPRPTTIPTEVLGDREPMYGKLNTRNVNIRLEPSANSRRITQLAEKGTALEIIDSTSNRAKELWYCIWLDEEEVYILAKFVDIVTVEEFINGE